MTDLQRKIRPSFMTGLRRRLPPVAATVPPEGPPGGGPGFGEDHGEQIATRDRTVTRRPRLFRVVLHNDDYTSMEFVIHVLKVYFHRNDSEAHRIMLEVHHKGSGTAGVYPYDVAESKIAKVTSEARQSGMPLMLSMEAE